MTMSSRRGRRKAQGVRIGFRAGFVARFMFLGVRGGIGSGGASLLMGGSTVLPGEGTGGEDVGLEWWRRPTHGGVTKGVRVTFRDRMVSWRMVMLARKRASI